MHPALIFLWVAAFLFYLTKLFCALSIVLCLAEMMKKRFSKDLLGKERHVWIEPRTKSIHWLVRRKKINVRVLL